MRVTTAVRPSTASVNASVTAPAAAGDARAGAAGSFARTRRADGLRGGAFFGRRDRGRSQGADERRGRKRERSDPTSDATDSSRDGRC